MNIDISTDVENHISPIRVLDEYYQEVPEGLYIPPEAFAILLAQFEGPLDFLLYLVQKNGLDLKQLDIAPIAKQYLQYMEQMKSLNIELTADYLVMAALLADLKSRLLLPKPQLSLEIENDPKKELVDRLEQYLKIKQASERLSQLAILDRDVFSTQVMLGQQMIIHDTFDIQMLHDAMLCVFHRPDPLVHNIENEPVHLEERMQFICEKVSSGEQYYFSELLVAEQGRLGLVVTFVAVLELVKQQHIAIIHSGDGAPLCIQGKQYAQSRFS